MGHLYAANFRPARPTHGALEADILCRRMLVVRRLCDYTVLLIRSFFATPPLITFAVMTINQLYQYRIKPRHIQRYSTQFFIIRWSAQIWLCGVVDDDLRSFSRRAMKAWELILCVSSTARLR